MEKDMPGREKTTIYLDREVKRAAVELGLNLSKVCENALKAVIINVSNTYKGLGPGFEPGRRTPQEAPTLGGAYGPVEPVAGVQIPFPASLRSAGKVCTIFSPATGPQANQTTSSRLLIMKELESRAGCQQLLAKFRDFLKVDLQRGWWTVAGHTQAIGRFLRWLKGRPISRDVIRSYLDLYRDKEPYTYANQLKALKVFFRDFLGRGDLTATFKFPRKGIEVKRIPGKDKLQAFYRSLQKLKDPRLCCFFLLYATSGWRRREVMALLRENVDLNARMMQHTVKSSATKGRLPGFFNEEAQDVLRRYLQTRRDNNPKLLPISERTFRRLWHQAAKDCGFMVQPQQLREWFCEEMSNLGVPERYIDAFCGRVPKSVLAKHYTDYLPEKLKPIYDKAGLRVLS